MLGQPVDRLALQLRRAMLVPVPFRVGRHVAQPEIRRHVDDLDLRIGGEHRRGDLLRRAVRQAAEDGVEPGPVHLLPFDQARQVEHEEMRKDLRHRLAGMRVGGERDDLDVRMPGGEADEVGAGIAGCAENADPDLLHRPAPPREMPERRSSGSNRRSKCAVTAPTGRRPDACARLRCALRTVRSRIANEGGIS